MSDKQQVTAVLAYQGKEYTVTNQYDDIRTDDDFHGIYYHWTDGNYGCDCNRSLFIGDIDEDFPELPCGTTIELRSLTVDGRELLS